MSIKPGCPINACQNDRQRNHVMCPDHWAMVPAPLQREVYRAWARYNQGIITFSAYMTTRQQAIDAAEKESGATPLAP